MGLYLSIVKIDPGRPDWLGGENRSNLENIMSVQAWSAAAVRLADKYGMALLLVLGFAAAGATAAAGF